MEARSESTPASLARLTPWTSAVHSLSYIVQPRDRWDIEKVQEIGILWAKWPIFDVRDDDKQAIDSNGHERVTRAFEAIDMLGLLYAAGRYDAWAAFVGAAWPKDASPWLVALPPCCVQIGIVASVKAPARLTDWAQEYLFGERSLDDIARQTQLRTLLDEVFSIHDVASIPVCAIPVLLAPGTAQAETDASAMLVEVANVANMQANIKHGRIGMGQASTPRAILTEIWIYYDLSESDVVTVGRIVRDGVRIARLPLFDTRLSETLVSTNAPSFHTILASETQKRNVCGAWKVEGRSMMGRHTVPRLFSSVLDSQSIRELTIIRPDGDRGEQDVHIWPWLALSVFSCQATNRLKQLDLNVEELAIEDVAAMETLIRAPNPLAHFYGYPSEVEAWVVASSFWLSDAAGDGPELSLGAESLQVRVVDDRLEDWVGVLLPGYGRAWVARAKCLLVSKTTSATSRQSHAVEVILIRALDLSTSEAVGALLRVVGGGVQHLQLYASTCIAVVLPEEWYQHVLYACPQLDVLELNGLDVGSLGYLTEAFDRDHTRVSQLTLHLVKPKLARVIDLFDELADKSSSMARRLTSLTVHIVRPNDPIADVYEVLHRILTSNYYLQNVTIKLAYRTALIGTPRIQTDVSSFSKYDDDPVRGRRGPLALKAKLAFLSVTVVDGLPRTKPPKYIHGNLYRTMRLLDQHVVSLIFQLSAESTRRRVHVAIDT